ncbi:hypothetical protein OIU77_019369 [Salix suchowensis]|uniref:CBS domain-containing protein n=1 Tax=Salix suchowensis TaxID=1278906 RepID=A0ABQ9CFR6_9ROSI|nr:hypothetical protein OIU78_020409 [Salix suchowensis]KAJ6398572.1 hypothetical protein OIU77_019369 [Salix suchowensis]
MLLNKTNGKVVGDLMTPAPLVVRETTNLEDAAKLLLETKYRRLPVVDADGKLVGIITRGNVHFELMTVLMMSAAFSGYLFMADMIPLKFKPGPGNVSALVDKPELPYYAGQEQ